MELWILCGFISMGIALIDDVREQKIRWIPVTVSIGIGLIFRLCFNAFEWKTACMGMFPGVISFLVSKACNECIGAGDSLLILGIGLLHGFSFCIKVVLNTCICIFFFSVIMLFIGRLHRKSQVACMPFLFLGYLGAWLL